VRRQRIETAIEIVVAAKIYDEDCSGHRLNIIATVRETTTAFYLLMSNGVQCGPNAAYCIVTRPWTVSGFAAVK